MATRLLPPGYQVLDANGRPYSGALAYTYEAGTSTPKVTYSDGGGTIANANPIVADSAGRFGDVFATVGDYRLVMKSSAGVTIYTSDPVSGATSNATIPGSGFRNMLINADFSINQRGASSSANDVYGHDGWYVLTNTGSVTIASQTVQADGIPTNVRLTQPDATPKRFGYAQIIESPSSRPFRAATMTLSGQIRHSLAAPIRYAILTWTGTADTVTSNVVLDWTSSSYTAGGFFLASNVTVQQVGSITPSAATWTDLTAISATLSSSTNNIIIFLWTEGTTAQNATLDLANIQIEQGGEASAFEYLPRDTQLFRCYRYYQKSFALTTVPAQNSEPATALRFVQSVGASTAQNGMRVDLKMPMRNGSYTITLFNPSAANAQVRNNTTGADCSSTSTSQTGDDKFTITTTTAGGSAAGNALIVHYTAEAAL